MKNRIFLVSNQLIVFLGTLFLILWIYPPSALWLKNFAFASIVLIALFTVFRKKKIKFTTINLKNDSKFYSADRLLLETAAPFYDESYDIKFYRVQDILYLSVPQITAVIIFFLVLSFSAKNELEPIIFWAMLSLLYTGLYILALYIFFTATSAIQFSRYKKLRNKNALNSDLIVVNRRRFSDKNILTRDYLQAVYDVFPQESYEFICTLFERAKSLGFEIGRLARTCDVADNYFIDDTILLDDIMNEFFVNLIDKSRNVGKHSNYTKAMTVEFLGHFEPRIMEQAKQYMSALDKTQNKITNIMLGDYNELAIDGDVKKVKALCRKIIQASNNQPTQQLIIAKSLNDDLLPSLITTWNTAKNQNQKSQVEAQLEQLISFLDKQLNTLNSHKTAVTAEGSPAHQLLVEHDNGKPLDSLDQKIDINGRYLDMLERQW